MACINQQNITGGGTTNTSWPANCGPNDPSKRLLESNPGTKKEKLCQCFQHLNIMDILSMPESWQLDIWLDMRDRPMFWPYSSTCSLYVWCMAVYWTPAIPGIRNIKTYVRSGGAQTGTFFSLENLPDGSRIQRQYFNVCMSPLKNKLCSTTPIHPFEEISGNCGNRTWINQP